MIGRIRLYLVALGALIAAFVVAYFKGRADADAEQKAKQAEGRVKAIKEAEEIENEVEALDVDTLKRRSTKWVRGK